MDTDVELADAKNGGIGAFGSLGAWQQISD